MVDFVHHPDHKHTGKTLNAKTHPHATQFPISVEKQNKAIRNKMKASRQIAEAIRACLKEDLPDYIIELQARTDGNYDINIDKIPLTFNQNKWMFTLSISDNTVTLFNHNGVAVLNPNKVEYVGFILEDPNFFEKLVNQIQEWTHGTHVIP